jgi:hypothetical protein
VNCRYKQFVYAQAGIILRIRPHKTNTAVVVCSQPKGDCRRSSSTKSAIKSCLTFLASRFGLKLPGCALLLAMALLCCA